MNHLIGCAYSDTCGTNGLCACCAAPTAAQSAAWDRELARVEAIGLAAKAEREAHWARQAKVAAAASVAS